MYFTSQITNLPGPGHTPVVNVGEELHKEKRDNIIHGDEKFRLRNDIFYGAHMQDQKYVKEQKPSRAYVTYMKGQKNEWSRKQNDPNAIG